MQLDESITEDIENLYQKLKDKPLILKDEVLIIQKLSELLRDSMPKFESYGIAFSGGVDSSVLALLSSQLKKEFTLYTVGLENSPDLLAATEAARIMNWKLKCRILTIEEVESIIENVVKILAKHNAVNVVNVGVAGVEYAVLEMAKQDKQINILGGLGSEEIFAGYERHKENTHEACWQGLKEIYSRDLVRDNAISSHFGIKFHCPFLNENLLEFAMQIHPILKINDNEKKIILRQAAVNLGLPVGIAYRKKMAAQYGSSFDKVLSKIARSKGFKYKKDYLNSLL